MIKNEVRRREWANRQKDMQSISTYATVTNTCDGIVGSFDYFNCKLKARGFAGHRVRVTYAKVYETSPGRWVSKPPAGEG